LGRSRGGLTTKIHLAADTSCRPLSRVTSAGQRNDALGFEPVMGRLQIRRRGPGRPRTRPGQVLADKAYSSRSIRSHLRRRRIRAVIPEPIDQTRHRARRGSGGGRPVSFDPDAYRLRNTVERAVNKLRSYRAVATRYDKLRQTRLRLPRHRRRRRHRHLATQPRHLIYETRPSSARGTGPAGRGEGWWMAQRHNLAELHGGPLDTAW
jgi:hypothetical protein